MPLNPVHSTISTVCYPLTAGRYEIRCLYHRFQANPDFRLSFTVRLLASVCFIGYIPVASGTFGCLPVLFLLLLLPDPTMLFILAGTSSILGILICGEAVRVFRKHDPSEFVLDEVAGYAVTMLFIPLTPVNIILGFFLFRFFDIVKPLGVRKLDRMNVPESIMYDDLLAGVYSNLVLQVIFRFLQ